MSGQGERGMGCGGEGRGDTSPSPSPSPLTWICRLPRRSSSWIFFSSFDCRWMVSSFSRTMRRSVCTCELASRYTVCIAHIEQHTENNMYSCIYSTATDQICTQFKLVLFPLVTNSVNFPRQLLPEFTVTEFYCLLKTVQFSLSFFPPKILPKIILLGTLYTVAALGQNYQGGPRWG